MCGVIPFPITTQRLILRHFHLLDDEPMRQIFGDANVMRFGDGIQTGEWIAAWLRSCLERYRALGYGPYAIIEQRSQTVIGYCGLFFYPDVNGKPEIEIGYRLARSAWGQGYASEEALAVRDYAFSSLGVQRLIAMIDPANHASIRVAEKLGMHFEQEVMFESYTHPDHVYVIQKGEFDDPR